MPNPRKIARNAEVRRLARAGWTYQRIGERFGISKQRVCQIVLTTSRPRRESAGAA